MSSCLTIIGSENYTDYDEFRRIVGPYLQDSRFKTLLSHGTTGTFTMSQRIASDNNIHFDMLGSNISETSSLGDTLPESKIFKIDGSLQSQILEKCDQILVFADPKGLQIWDFINYARSVGKSCRIFNISTEPKLTNSVSSEWQTPSPYPYLIPGIPTISTSTIDSYKNSSLRAKNDFSPSQSPSLIAQVHISLPDVSTVEKDCEFRHARSGDPTPQPGASRSEVRSEYHENTPSGVITPNLAWHDHTIDVKPRVEQTKVVNIDNSVVGSPSSRIEDRSNQGCQSLTSIRLGVDVGSSNENREITPRQRPKLVIRPKLPSQIIQEDWSLSRICQEAVPPGWESVFTDAVMELTQISELIDVEAKKSMIVPLKRHIFRALEVLPMSKVRVVIWGQDPYHQLLSYGEPRAVGLSFSVARSDTVPRSLVNIYKEISDNIPDFVIPTHGDLRNWSQQGVLLLNSSLTCRVNEPNSHAKYMIWLPFITRLIKGIEIHRPNCIHLLWGKEAQKLKQYINNKGIILTASHPSPLSAERGFFGCQHFSQVNRILTDLGESPIDWNLP
jgi:uracil-DNA glycosylase